MPKFSLAGECVTPPKTPYFRFRAKLLVELCPFDYFYQFQFVKSFYRLTRDCSNSFNPNNYGLVKLRSVFKKIGFVLKENILVKNCLA